MKTFSKIEISVIKSTAKNVAQFVAKKQKVEEQIKEVEEKVAEQIRKRASEKIEKLEAEKAEYQSLIDSMSAPVKQITGGYTTEDLVEVKKEGTGQIDQKSGKEIMKTVCILKYPETIVPPTTENVAGSDYDIDAESFQETAEDEGMGVSDAQEEEPAAEQETEVASEEDETDPFAGFDAGVDPFNQ